LMRGGGAMGGLPMVGGTPKLKGGPSAFPFSGNEVLVPSSSRRSAKALVDYREFRVFHRRKEGRMEGKPPRLVSYAPGELS